MDTEAALRDLEAAIKRRSKWRGRWVFYQVLEAELAPILTASADPDGLRAQVRVMLERYGHALEAPRLPGRSCDAAPLCRPSPHAQREAETEGIEPFVWLLPILEGRGMAPDPSISKSHEI